MFPVDLSPVDPSPSGYVPFFKVDPSPVINLMHYALGINSIKILNIDIKNKLSDPFLYVFSLTFTIYMNRLLVSLDLNEYSLE